MEEYPVFPNAPIVEALLDIRVKLPDEVNLETLENIHEKMLTRFPEKLKRQSLEAQVKLPNKVLPQETAFETSAKGGTVGYLFRSPSEQKIFQARLDGFSFNKLKPYENWNVFREEARELWNLYKEFAKPLTVTRIALRYINKVKIPLPFGDFKEYILTIPEVAPKLPQCLAHLFMQIVIPYPEIQAFANITETIERQSDVKTVSFIFDIDAYCEKSYDVNDAELWKDFEKLHSIKNEIFFNSITDKTKELFK